jgi:uncharacterized protein
LRLLFVVGHPAHVHLFRNAIAELRSRGHVVDIAAIEKETTLQLLSLYGFAYTPLGKNVPTIAGKLVGLPIKDLRLAVLLSRTRPDLVVSTGSPYAAQASAALSIPHIAFSDTEIASAVIRLMLPFTDAVCTPSCFWLDLGRKHIRYQGYHELAYLHPSRFGPNLGVLELVGADRSDRLILIRFASWDSSHDLGSDGAGLATEQELISFVRELESFGRVLISSERRVPDVLRDLVMRIPLDRVHDLLAAATLYIGEGATMASEAGVLGTPWVFVSGENRGYLRDQQEQYGLGFHVTSPEDALARAKLLLEQDDIKDQWKGKRERLLREKIDVTAFMVGFLEQWPPSGAHRAVIDSLRR